MYVVALDVGQEMTVGVADEVALDELTLTLAD